MPKKIKHESFKYCFLKEATANHYQNSINPKLKWIEFINDLTFLYKSNEIEIQWSQPEKSSLKFSLNEVNFYKKKKANLESSQILEDINKSKNKFFFENSVNEIAYKAGFMINKNITVKEDQKEIERKFHDEWANNEDLNKINILRNNEVCTAPEMRYITKRLGDLKGRTLLDIGCGLGEASVYFAMKGAEVTSSDLSEGMLNVTSKLAVSNGVKVKIHLADAEDLKLKKDQKFDVVYAGNLLHHVNIEEMINNAKKHLNKNGIFISWDPLAYNPAINVYRNIATDVRTPDEHPITIKDLNFFNKSFDRVEKKYFWFFTLIIFGIMAILQRRNPNEERFWKVILDEGDKWKWLYKPLEILDKIILFIFPPLRLLCWNVVLIGINEKKK